MPSVRDAGNVYVSVQEEKYEASCVMKESSALDN